MILDHGVIANDNVNGSIALGSLNVECSRETDISLSIVAETDNRIYLDDNRTLYSSIDINGFPGNKGIVLSIGAGEVIGVDIRSVLGGVGGVGGVGNIPAGHYSNQTIAILFIQ